MRIKIKPKFLWMDHQNERIFSEFGHPHSKLAVEGSSPFARYLEVAGSSPASRATSPTASNRVSHECGSHLSSHPRPILRRVGQKTLSPWDIGFLFDSHKD